MNKFPLFPPTLHFIVWFCWFVCLTSCCVCSSERVSWLCCDLCGGSSCQWKTAWTRIPLVSRCCFLFTEPSLNSSSSQRLVLLWVTPARRHTLRPCRPHLLKWNSWSGLWLLVGVCIASWVFYIFLFCVDSIVNFLGDEDSICLSAFFSWSLLYIYYSATIEMIWIQSTPWIIYLTSVFL